MDIFDVLTAISKRKITFMDAGINEKDALTKAELFVSEEYHISISDIKKLVGQVINGNDVYNNHKNYLAS